MTSTISGLQPQDDRALGKRRLLYGVTTGVLTLIMALGVVDGIGWVRVYGVDTGTVRASAQGYELVVDYPALTRPALASPFEITVTTAAGSFDGPIRLRLRQAYLGLWDVNALVPAPSSERADGEWVEWEFDPPDGDTLVVSYDARVEPAVQSARRGAVALVDDAGATIAEVAFTTQVRP